LTLVAGLGATLVGGIIGMRPQLAHALPTRPKILDVVSAGPGQVSIVGLRLNTVNRITLTVVNFPITNETVYTVPSPVVVEHTANQLTVQDPSQLAGRTLVDVELQANTSLVRKHIPKGLEIR
jgi:hypothetical protein